MKKQDFIFIDKCVFFPEEKILAVGDLHLGYEYMLKETGTLVPESQFEQTKNDLEKIFSEIKKRKLKVEKVIFLGDIKHFFAYKKIEKNLFLQLMDLIGRHVKEKNIIVIKGNHEKMAEIADKKLVDFYIEKNIAFIHGDREIKEAFSKNIKYIVMGHLHPAITLRDSQNIKAEKYKCFLIGNYNKKEVIILPSFLPTIEGTSMNEYLTDMHCFISERKLMNFSVHIIGEKEIFDFGKLKKLVK